MQSMLQLFPQRTQYQSEGQLRSCLLRETTATAEVNEFTLWYLLPEQLPLPEELDCEAYLLASLLYAMRENHHIVVRGKLSKTLLANLTELQLVWNNWCPELYSIVIIEVAEPYQSGLDNPNADSNTNLNNKQPQVAPPMAKAICAFSGGVDASFTAYRHSKGYAGAATQDLKAGVLVHGFDIDLANEQDFLTAFEKSKQSLTDLGLETHVVKTNVKELFNKKLRLNWEYSFGLAAASVLNNFKQYASIGLLGSGEPYSSLQAPWGSHPITDPLSSGYDFSIVHDGAGFDRTHKLKRIAEWQIGSNNIRVCWQGDDQGANCGRCEKCLRTRLNFMLAGINDPQCFPNKLQQTDFDGITLNNPAVLSEWKLIQAEILTSGIGKEWLPSVEKVIKRKPAKNKIDRLFPLNSKRRKAVTSVSKRLIG